jgi:hypothetical protein
MNSPILAIHSGGRFSIAAPTPANIMIMYFISGLQEPAPRASAHPLVGAGARFSTSSCNAAHCRAVASG